MSGSFLLVTVLGGLLQRRVERAGNEARSLLGFGVKLRGPLRSALNKLEGPR